MIFTTMELNCSIFKRAEKWEMPAGIEPPKETVPIAHMSTWARSQPNDRIHFYLLHYTCGVV